MLGVQPPPYSVYGMDNRIEGTITSNHIFLGGFDFYYNRTGQYWHVIHATVDLESSLKFL
jgi:hypothetical protein